jgi:hypothetical protein
MPGEDLMVPGVRGSVAAIQSILVTLVDELERTREFDATALKKRIEENARSLDNRRSTSKTPVRDAATAGQLRTFLKLLKASKEPRPWKPFVIDGGKEEGDAPDSGGNQPKR